MKVRVDINLTQETKALDQIVKEEAEEDSRNDSLHAHAAPYSKLSYAEAYTSDRKEAPNT